MTKNEILTSPSLELLNSEGPLLIAYKASDGRFYIFDQFKSFIAVFDNETIKEFITGKVSIIDSKKKEWNYKSQSSSLKPSKAILNKFIKL